MSVLPSQRSANDSAVLSAPSAPPHRRRFFRFGLRALFVLTALVAVATMLVIVPAQRQRAAVAEISRNGGFCLYDDSTRWPTLQSWLVDWLGKDVVLSVVDAGGNRGTTDSQELKATLLKHAPSLKSLVRLHLEHMEICDSDLVQLAKASSVGVLCLNYCAVEGAALERLHAMPNLQCLILEGNPIRPDFPLALGGLGALTVLVLQETGITGKSLVELPHLKKLEFFYADRTNLDDGAMAHVGQVISLQTLSLTATQVTDLGLQHLTKLHSLRSISLCDTSTSDAGLAALRAMTGLQLLRLAKTRVTGRGFIALRGLTALCDLDLDGCPVDDEGLYHIANLPALACLKIRGTMIDSAGLAHLARCSKLEKLDLSHTRVDDTGLAHLAGLRNLRSLVLTGSGCTSAGVANLERALPRLEVAR